jgi:hypothetical protein
MFGNMLCGLCMTDVLQYTSSEGSIMFGNMLCGLCVTDVLQYTSSEPDITSVRCREQQGTKSLQKWNIDTQERDKWQFVLPDREVPL